MSDNTNVRHSCTAPTTTRICKHHGETVFSARRYRSKTGMPKVTWVCVLCHRHRQRRYREEASRRA